MIFISYSQKDSMYLEELVVHLKGLKLHAKPNETFEWWSDKDIPVGDRWRERLEKALRKARVAILLVSPDFMQSEFIANNELPIFLDKERNGRLKILWVLLRKCAWKLLPILEEHNAIRSPEKDKPLADIRQNKRDGVWTELAELAKANLDLPSSPEPEPQESSPLEEIFHVDESKKDGNDLAVYIKGELLRNWCGKHLNKEPRLSDLCREWLNEVSKDGAFWEQLEMPWKVPEPNTLEISKDPSIAAGMKVSWLNFEKLTARLYPRFRDAHLVFLLHSKCPSEDLCRLPEDQQQADHDQIRRILLALLRKHREFRTKLKDLLIEGQNDDFDKWRRYLDKLPACHLAILWGLELVFEPRLGPKSRQHWLHQCTLLSERLCYWLLQAHAVARASLPAEQ